MKDATTRNWALAPGSRNRRYAWTCNRSVPARLANLNYIYFYAQLNISERGAPLSTAGFARMLERAAEAAGLEIKIHPHMLRHACGFALANVGHDTRALQAYLGHKNIQHTVRYTELAPDRFRHFWKD
jgi:site-specific recombinase XerD